MLGHRGHFRFFPDDSPNRPYDGSISPERLVSLTWLSALLIMCKLTVLPSQHVTSLETFDSVSGS